MDILRRKSLRPARAKTTTARPAVRHTGNDESDPLPRINKTFSGKEARLLGREFTGSAEEFIQRLRTHYRDIEKTEPTDAQLVKDVTHVVKTVLDIGSPAANQQAINEGDRV